MKLLHKNSLSGVGQLVLTAGLTFFSIPIFIRTLGEEAYGAFSIVTLAGNLNIFANLGLNTALLKFLSVQGKSKESDYDIIVTLVLLTIVMVPLSLLAISYQTYILQGFLGLSDVLYVRVESMYRCVVVANLVILIGQTFTTVLDSQQRMYLTNFYQLLYSIMYWGGIITVVSLGYNMDAVGIVILTAAIIWFGIVIIAAWRSWGRVQLSGLGTQISRIARKQISFGSNVYAAGLLNMLFEPMTKILVSRLIGVREVGYLEIAYKVRSQLWSLMTKVTYPIYPKIAQEVNIVRLSQFIGLYQSTMITLIVPFLSFFVIAFSDLLNFWLPASNPIIITATLSISSTYLIGTIALPTYYFLLSRQHVQKTVWLQLINVAVNGSVIVLTYKWLGLYGVILGNSLAILSSLILSLYFQKKYLYKLNINLSSQWRVLVYVPIGFVFAYITNTQLADPLLRIGVVGICAIITYALLLYGSRDQLKSWTA